MCCVLITYPGPETLNIAVTNAADLHWKGDAPILSFWSSYYRQLFALETLRQRGAEVLSAQGQRGGGHGVRATAPPFLPWLGICDVHTVQTQPPQPAALLKGSHTWQNRQKIKISH